MREKNEKPRVIHFEFHEMDNKTTDSYCTCKFGFISTALILYIESKFNLFSISIGLISSHPRDVNKAV